MKDLEKAKNQTDGLETLTPSRRQDYESLTNSELADRLDSPLGGGIPAGVCAEAARRLRRYEP